MKINKTNILAAFGSLIAVFAFFAIVGVNNASACGTTECEYPPLTADCIVSVSHAKIGDVVTWTTEGEGGNGYYSFYWSGTDGLESNYQTTSATYDSAGTKTGTVEITSNGETISRTCSVEIEDDYVPPPTHNNDDVDGSCTGTPSRPDEDEKVTWKAYPEGGNGNYDYDWSGDVDGDDKIETKRYDDSGTKTAHVRITSDGHSVTKTCTVKVEKKNDDLKATCDANHDEVSIDDKVKWTVHAKGGDGHYDYDWSGDVNGDDETESKSYSSDGRKDVEVRVESDGDHVTAKCHVEVKKEKVTYTTPSAPTGGIYLSSIPATGISPTMKVALFVAGLFMWSAFLAYLYIARKNEKMKEAAMLAEIGE